MCRVQAIKLLLEVLEPYYIEVIDESNFHQDHLFSSILEEETHIKIIIAAKKLDNLSKIVQHRKIKKLLINEFANGMHSLSIKVIS